MKGYFILIISLSFLHNGFGQTASRTHLKDTEVIHGNFVLFLIPDVTRYDNESKTDENIANVDGDFGVAISATIDSIARNKKYKSIQVAATSRRFILIKDYKNKPIIIDRDTAGYGLILTSGKRVNYSFTTYVHSGDYLSDVDDYFNLSNK